VSSGSSHRLELGRALFEEGGRALLLVVRGGAQAEIGGFECEALALAGVHSLIDRFERQPHRDRRVGHDLLQDLLGARDEIRRRHDFVDEPDAVRLLRADHSG
jgi:hypothetical protein